MPDFPKPKTVGLFDKLSNRKIIGELEKTANLLLFPPVETEETQISFAVENLWNFDWLIFADVSAVEYFLLLLEKFQVDSSELDCFRICAFGETVADALRFAQVHSDVISKTIEANEVFKVLCDYEPDLVNIRILIPKEENQNPAIAERLKNSGALVSELPIYRVLKNTDASLTRLKTLLLGGAIDEFVFTAARDVLDFARLFPARDIANLLQNTKVIATDSATRAALGEYGFGQISIFNPQPAERISQ